MSNVIRIDFSKPQALRLDDQLVLREVWEALGQPRGEYQTWATERLEHYENGNDFQTRESDSLNFIGKKIGKVDHIVSVQVALEIAANGHGEVGHRVRRFFGECLRLLNETRPELVPTQTLPDVLSSDFLQQVTDRFRQLERDKAVADRRAFTAMGTAGGLAKANSQLRDRIGEGPRWLAASGVKARYGVELSETSIGCRLKKFCVERGVEMQSVPHPRYGSVKSYPVEQIELWLETLPATLAAEARKEAKARERRRAKAAREGRLLGLPRNLKSP